MPLPNRGSAIDSYPPLEAADKAERIVFSYSLELCSIVYLLQDGRDHAVSCEGVLMEVAKKESFKANAQLVNEARSLLEPIYVIPSSSSTKFLDRQQ